MKNHQLKADTNEVTKISQTKAGFLNGAWPFLWLKSGRMQKIVYFCT